MLSNSPHTTASPRLNSQWNLANSALQDERHPWIVRTKRFL